MRRKIIIVPALVFVLVLLLNLGGSGITTMRAAMADALAPAIALCARLIARLNPWETSPTITAETHRQLLLETAQLRRELHQLSGLEEENRQLRRMLGLAEQNRTRLIAAEVITRDVNAWWQTARLNKGAADGVASDMPVITDEALVGRIARVSATTSDILFVADPHCRIAARLSRSGAFGIVRGQGVSWRGQTSCRMDFIDRHAQITPGDEVVTSGLGGIFPAGLLIGRIESVAMDASGLYQTAELTPIANTRLLELVFIITRSERSSAQQPKNINQ